MDDVVFVYVVCTECLAWGYPTSPRGGLTIYIIADSGSPPLGLSSLRLLPFETLGDSAPCALLAPTKPSISLTASDDVSGSAASPTPGLPRVISL